MELVKGKRKTSSRKFYPGYILVRMHLDDETWHIVNDTAKVTGFLGGRNKPTPLSDEEADQILNRMEAGKLKPQPKYFFESGDEIRVIDGPFTNFNGTVEEVNPEKGKIKVLVSILAAPRQWSWTLFRFRNVSAGWPTKNLTRRQGEGERRHGKKSDCSNQVAGYGRKS